jgi:KaiC/GvpD/RAD55 family RecA-like ATPase
MAPTIRKKKKRDADEVSEADPAPAGRVSTGIEGLDEITNGGLVPRRAYLVRGKPGTGKTTVGLHFLVDGAARGDRVLCIALAEPVHEIRDNAESVGIDLSGVEFLDLSPTAAHFTEDESYDVFSAAEVERAPVTRKIVEAVEKLKPQRVFLTRSPSSATWPGTRTSSASRSSPSSATSSIPGPRSCTPPREARTPPTTTSSS